MPAEIDRIEDEYFLPEIKRLISLKRTLKLYGLVILLFLFGSLLALGGFAIYRKRNMIYEKLNDWNYSVNAQFELMLLVMVFILVFCGVIFLFRFSMLRNQGMIIYEELTDEIDWSRKRKEFIHRPSMELRIVIKEFLKSTDLPFTSGANGQAFYIVLFIIILISSIMIKVFV